MSYTTDTTTTCWINTASYDYGENGRIKYKYGTKKYLEEKKPKMRGLYDVYVVDPRKQGRLIDVVKGVIAKDQNEAIMKANVVKIAQSVGLELDEVDYYANCIGCFIRPRKETHKVKVVRDDD